MPMMRAIPAASLRSLSWRGARRCRAFWRGGFLLAKQRMGRELKEMDDRLDAEMDEVRAELCDARGELARLHARRRRKARSMRLRWWELPPCVAGTRGKGRAGSRARGGGSAGRPNH
jgi:hypothetical protein